MSCSALYQQIKSGEVALSDLTDVEIIALWDCLDQLEKQLVAGLLSRGGGGGGSFPTFTNVSAPTTLESVSDSGSTGTGLYEVSIANVGGAAGTVGGVAFPVGASVTYRGYVDWESSEMRLPGSITYDATGTEFLISKIVFTTP